MSAASALITGGVDRDSVRERPLDLVAAAADASHYLLTPQAVVVAQDETAVARVLAACAAEQLPVTFRAGGTSLSGQAGGSGVLVDVRRGFRGVEVLDDGARVRVAPGTTVRAVNAALRPYARAIGPDPASEGACTVGGVVANNSSGMSCGLAGTAYATTDALRLVLPSGTVVDTAYVDADARLARDEPGLHVGLASLRDRVRADPQACADIARLFAIKNTMGYGINALVDHDEPVQILAHLVIGSEGTLAFVSSVTLRTLPVRPHAATGLLVLPDLAAATDRLAGVIGSGPSAVELLDAGSLRVAARAEGFADLAPAVDDVEPEARAALLVEYQADTAAALQELVEAAAPVLDGVVPSTDPGTRARLWHMRKGLYAAVAGARRAGTTALLEDVAVPVAALSSTCEALQALFRTYGYDETVIFGHARDGNIHFMVTEDFGDPAGVERYAAFTEEMVQVVLQHGGTLKAEHGTGRVMAPYVARQYGPVLHAVMREIKSLCDPAGVLNPGVVLSDDDHEHLHHLKTVSPVEDEVDRCVECGFCEPVCPSRDLTLTPRQRIVARRAEAAMRSRGDTAAADAIAADYDYDGLQTCAADGMCQTACPVSIDTGQLVRRLRGQSRGPVAQAAGRAAAKHWHGVVALGTRGTSAAHTTPRIARAATAVGRSMLGVDTVPLWSADLPGGGSTRHPREEPRPDVVLVPSCTGSLFGGDASAADAFMTLCERAGVKVRVPGAVGSLCCGMPWSSKGLADGALAMAERAAAVLGAASQEGHTTVVMDAASCSEGMVKSLRLASSQVHVEDAVPFVAREVLGRLTPRHVVRRLALHPTCASERAGWSDALRTLAQAVAEEVYVPPAWGCCAFAGDRGMLHPELTASATATQAAQVQDYAADAHASCNRTCELGMSRATGENYRHVLLLLEEATRGTTAGAAGGAAPSTPVDGQSTR